jgi:hypothetical protein
VNLTEAIERVRREKLDWCETIYATSDGQFFLNSTPDHVLNHAEENGLKILTIKGAEITLPVKESEPKKESESKPSKDKK